MSSIWNNLASKFNSFTEQLKELSLQPVVTEQDLQTLDKNTTQNNKELRKNVIVCLDNGHGEETPGKRSPWSANAVPPQLPFREYSYCRDLVKDIAAQLIANGYEVFIVTPETRDVGLSERANRVNKVVNSAKKQGKHVLMISVHNNAAGNGAEWKKAYGWSAWTTKGQTNSDQLAQCLYEAAKQILPSKGMKIRTDRTDGDDDYESNFTIIYKSNCPAVLTENMFQDCVDEVKWMLTNEGKQALVNIHCVGIDLFVKLMGW